MDLLSSLHIPTLAVAGFCVVLMCGLLTLLNWRQHPSERILLYTGLMLLLSCPAIVGAVMRDSTPHWIAAIASNVILLFNAGLAWQAVRVFFGRKERWVLTSLGAIFWLALSLLPGFLEDAALRIRIFSVCTFLYMFAGCYELIRARAHSTFSVAPMFCILLMHALLHIGRLIFDTPQAGLRHLSSVPLIELLILEGVLYVIGTVTVSLMMVKDRVQHQLREAAFLDPLTGISNRRLFNKRASALLHHASAMEQTVTVLLCDLDHFKKINDQRGHAFGDQTLTRFAGVIGSVLGAQDIYARIGGEEFACVLACNPQQALRYAEKIRKLYREGSDPEQRQTVSIGVASSMDVGYGLAKLMAASDAAMYQAKSCGRDQVRLYQEAALAVSYADEGLIQ